jgi:hypothetical protein
MPINATMGQHQCNDGTMRQQQQQQPVLEQQSNISLIETGTRRSLIGWNWMRMQPAIDTVLPTDFECDGVVIQVAPRPMPVLISRLALSEIMRGPSWTRL